MSKKTNEYCRNKDCTGVIETQKTYHCCCEEVQAAVKAERQACAEMLKDCAKKLKDYKHPSKWCLDVAEQFQARGNSK